MQDFYQNSGCITVHLQNEWEPSKLKVSMTYFGCLKKSRKFNTGAGKLLILNMEINTISKYER